MCIDLESQPDGRRYKKPAIENLNRLFHKIAKVHQGDKQIILLIDEVTIDNDCHDFSFLQLMYPFLNVLIAVNPAGFGLTKSIDINPPLGRCVLADKLLTKHRNSLQIAVFLAHVNRFINDKDYNYKCLDVAKDVPLEASTLFTGPLPIWIHRNEDVSDVTILKHLKVKFLAKATNATLVFSPNREELSKDTALWLNNDEIRWQVLNFANMTGCETDTLVVFIEDTMANMEALSRAKKHLIIVSK